MDAESGYDKENDYCGWSTDRGVVNGCDKACEMPLMVPCKRRTHVAQEDDQCGNVSDGIDSGNAHFSLLYPWEAFVNGSDGGCHLRNLILPREVSTN